MIELNILHPQNQCSQIFSHQFLSYQGVRYYATNHRNMVEVLVSIIKESIKNEFFFDDRCQGNKAVRLIDTYFSLFDIEAFDLLFKNWEKVENEIRLLFLDPLSHQGQIRGKELNTNALLRVNTGLFKLINSLYKTLDKPQLPQSLLNKNGQQTAFLHEQLSTVKDLQQHIPIKLAFYSTSTVSPVYIIAQFAIHGFLLYEKEASENPHILFVDEPSQANDPYDILYDNFEQVWKSSYATPGHHFVERKTYDVFISYSMNDERKADSIREKAEKRGLNCFLASHSIDGGDNIKWTVRNALSDTKYLLFLASTNSVSSKWALLECGAAWAFDATLVPILLQMPASQLPAFLGEYKALDLDEVDGFFDKIRNGAHS